MADWNLGNGGSAQTVSTPDGAAVSAQLDALVASSPRPGVLIGEREISVLRRGLTKDGWKRSLYLQPAEEHHGIYEGAGILSIANRSLEMDISIPERGGHFHRFFCECGTRLTIPDDLLPVPHYTCPACGKAYSGEDYDGAVRYLRHQRLASALLSLSIVYAIEKDRAYADKAADILLNYARAYPGPHTDHVTGGMLHQSLCEAVWAIPLAQAYDLIYYSRSLHDEDKQFVEERLFRPISEGLQAVGSAGNWGSWHLSAVGVIGLAIKDAQLVRYALEAFASQIADQLGDDGLWPESVHTYHFYPLRAFVHFAEGCYRAGIDIYNWEVRPGKSLMAMFAAPLQYVYPSFRLPAINDGWYDSFLPLDLYEIALRRWNDPAFAWVLKRGYRFYEVPINGDQRRNAEDFARSSFYAFLFGRDLPGRSAPPVLRSHNFPVLGICTLRNEDDAMVTLDYGPFLGHGHLDKLSFTFYSEDMLLAPDYGTPGYGAAILDWYRGTASHNTVVVDATNQEPAKETGLTAFHSGSFLQFAEAVAEDHYPGVAQIRRIVLVGKWCFVSDELSSDSEHVYDWMLRVEGEPLPPQGHVSHNFDCSGYPHMHIDCAYALAGDCPTEWKLEQGSLTMSLWSQGEPSEMALGTCPAETAARRVPVCVWRRRGRNAKFAAMLAASRTGAVDVSRDGCVVRVVEGEETDHIYLKDLGDEASGALLQTDGEVGVVRTREGVVHAIGLIGGSWIRWMDDLIIECPSRVDCVEVSFTERNPLIKYCCNTAGVVKLKTNARAMRINGHRTAATNADGQALLRVTSQMLGSMADFRS